MIRTRDKYKMSLKDAREAVVLAYDGGVIDDEDFCLKIPSFPTKAKERLTLLKWTTLSVKRNFASEKLTFLCLPKLLTSQKLLLATRDL